HYDGEVQLGDHALRQLPDLPGAPDRGLCQETFGLGDVETRVHAGDVIEELCDRDPARQHGDVGHEADVAHELLALAPRIAAEHAQLALVLREPENGIERGRLACTIGPDEPEYAA